MVSDKLDVDREAFTKNEWLPKIINGERDENSARIVMN